MKSI
ncbi:hypothetical protein ECEC1737_5774, partial [Escherichia coli EC1737]|jgi:regulator of telomere elongation helicase 1